MFKNAVVIISYILLYLFNTCKGEIYAIRFDSQFYFQQFEDVPATFGPNLAEGVVRGILVVSEPEHGCSPVKPIPPAVPPENETGKWILIVPRYTQVKNCSFEDKVRIAQAAGYKALIVHNVNSNQLVPMYAENSTGIEIPSVFVSADDGETLKKNYSNLDYFLVITAESPFNIKTHLLIPFAIVVAVCFAVMIIFMIVKCIKDRRRQRRHRLPTSSLNKIPTKKYQKGDPYETCAICLDDFIEGEKLRVLPCNHVYHTKCIDPWLTKNRRVCPICKRKVFAENESQHFSDSESESDDTAPLINSSNRGTQGGTFTHQTENPILRAQRSASQLGTTAHALVMASDHHSINGDLHSSSSSEDSTDPRHYSDSFLDSLEVQIHNNVASSSGNHNQNYNL
ncbi:E3 ubiquitin-protein ligase RNF13-like [Harmonia axyridis]|uniref:E3 ubiquitin-protein ligase RNF13-like n=1 Tax=Harmonia axyridis TaxID=115357 RepID=UPI001E2764E8|nr:E3 ubiquitin-protein ligase RNF13-like [Harmonia axyridis]